MFKIIKYVFISAGVERVVAPNVTNLTSYKSSSLASSMCIRALSFNSAQFRGPADLDVCKNRTILRYSIKFAINLIPELLFITSFRKASSQLLIPLLFNSFLIFFFQCTIDTEYSVSEPNSNNNINKVTY